MKDEDRSYIERLFAKVVAFALIFIVVAIVGGFVLARLMHIPVDVDKFYSLIGNAFYMMLGAVLGMIATGKNGDKP